MITVVSTAWSARTERLCRDSVARQQGVAFDHIYIDASKQANPRGAAQNVYETVLALPPERVVVWLDGDDWLAAEHVLSEVERDHRRFDRWLTYGQFQTADGAKGFAAQYPAGCDVRKHPWLATHLRTFRAGLLHRVKPADLQLRGKWVTLGVDQAIMLPMLEMAGEHALFTPDVRCIYNSSDAWETRATPADLRDERETVAMIRAKTPYGRMTSL